MFHIFSKHSGWKSGHDGECLCSGGVPFLLLFVSNTFCECVFSCLLYQNVITAIKLSVIEHSVLKSTLNAYSQIFTHT